MQIHRQMIGSGYFLFRIRKFFLNQLKSLGSHLRKVSGSCCQIRNTCTSVIDTVHSDNHKITGYGKSQRRSHTDGCDSHHGGHTENSIRFMLSQYTVNILDSGSDYGIAKSNFGFVVRDIRFL